MFGEYIDEYDDYELIINDIFGPTIQGEGNNVGKLTYFIRLQGCDQNPPCLWCDTMGAYNINGKNKKRMTFKEIINSLKAINKNNKNIFRIVITGGNPCIQQNIYEFVKYLRRNSYNNIEILLETQGTIINEEIGQFDYIVFSPKPPSSNINYIGQDVTNIVNFLEKYDDNVEVKIVIFNERDLKYAIDVFQLIKYKENINYTLTIGTPINKNIESMSPDKLINYLYNVEIPRRLLQKIRILPQVHNILKVK